MPFSIIYGPTASGKTTRAIEAFLAALARGEAPMFIAPGGPDARHFHREIIRSANNLNGGGQRGGRQPGVIVGGRVGTFDSLCREILDGGEAPLVISPGERLLLLRAIADSTRLGSLAGSAAFDGFVASLAALTAELESLGVDGARLGAALRSWAGGDRRRQELNKDIYRLLDRYESALADAGLTDPEKASRQAVEALTGGRAPARGAVIIDGFWDFTPLQHDLIARLVRSADVTITLPYVPGHPAYRAPAHHFERICALEGCEPLRLTPAAGRGKRTALAHLDGHLFEETPEEVKAGSAVRILKGAGARGQAEMVAAEILKLWREGRELDRMAVVCRGMGPDLRLIATALDACGVPHELAAPVPLGQTAVGRTALSVLDFACGSRSRESLFAYLRSPISDLPLPVVDDFDRRCRRYGIETAPDLLMDWRLRGSRPLDEIDRLTATAAGGAAALGDELSALIRQLLTRPQAGRDAPALWASDLPALESLETACREAAHVQAICPPRCAAGGQNAAARMLVRAIRQAAVRPAVAASRNCVRLLDPHRILNQRFDIVFVCGLLEKQFPAFGREDAFFPDSDRRELAAAHGLGLDSHDRRLDQERFLYFRTLSRAGERVYLCYPSCDEEGKPTVPSLFVDDTLRLYSQNTVITRERKIGARTFAPDEAPTAGEAIRSLAVWSRNRGAEPRRRLAAAVPDGLSGRLAACLAADLAPDATLRDPVILAALREQNGFQVTGLQKYLRCPFRYFVENLLAPVEMEPPAHGRKRGQVLHNILCRLGAQLKRSQLYLSDRAVPSEVEAIRNQLAIFIDEEFIDAGSGLETMILKNELEFHLDRFIDRELASGRRLEYFDFEVSFSGPAGGCGNRNQTDNVLAMGEVGLSGRLDRVDREPGSSRALVIDYKSSRKPVSQSEFEARREIQIPLYILALREVFGLEPAGGEYYALRGDKRGGLYLEGCEQMIGAGSGQIDPRDIVDRRTFEARLESAGALARGAAAGIRAGRIDIDPLDEKDCGWCGLGGVCRADARRQRESEGDD